MTQSHLTFQDMLLHGTLVSAIPELSAAKVASLAHDIDRTGFAVVSSYINDDILAQLRRLTIAIVAAHGGEYADLTGSEEISSTLLAAIGATPAFSNLLRNLYVASCGRAAPHQSLYQVLRCISGESGKAQAYFFHYDLYVVTALLPIIIPPDGLSGDLVLKPNRRRVHSSYLANLSDKILTDNAIAQKHFRRQAVSMRGGFTRVKIVPGNLYLFWGYRTLHANEPCDPNMIRATALFHFGDPHSGSRLRKFTGRAKARAATKPE